MMPRTTVMVPSVAIKGTILPLVTSRPFTRPTAAPNNRAISTDSQVP